MIEETLKTATDPCVFLSGGVDSMLVLSMVREMKPDVPVYCFNQDFTKEQWAIVENLIKIWDLEVRSFPPANTYMIPNGENLAQVAEYDLGGVTIPLVRDLIHSEKCSLDLDKTRLAEYPFDHDVVFLGTRAEDASTATGHPMRNPDTMIGKVRLIAPLFWWSRGQVMAEADRRELPYSKEFYIGGDEKMDTGNIVACSRCLQGHGQVFCPKEQQEIDVFEWDKDLALSNFRRKFGFVEVNNYEHIA